MQLIVEIRLIVIKCKINRLYNFFKITFKTNKIKKKLREIALIKKKFIIRNTFFAIFKKISYFVKNNLQKKNDF